MRSIGFTNYNQRTLAILIRMQVTLNGHHDIILRFQPGNQNIVFLRFQAILLQMFHIIIIMDVGTVCQELTILAILLLIVIMNTHVVCNQIMTMFYSHSFLPEHELAHPFVELRTLIFQTIHVGNHNTLGNILHIKPDESRDDARISSLIDDVEVLTLQGILQRHEVVEERTDTSTHPSFRTIDMFDFHTLVLIILIRVIRRRIHRNLMATLHQAH